MKNKFSIEIASLPTRDNLVSEIFYEDIQWVEISQETSELLIQFYPHPNKDFWEFPLEMALEVLHEAKTKLLQVG